MASRTEKDIRRASVTGTRKRKRCGVCTILWRKCPENCQFAPHYSVEDPDRLKFVTWAFSHCEIEKRLLYNIPEHLRLDAVRSLIQEAELRLANMRKFVSFPEPPLPPLTVHDIMSSADHFTRDRRVYCHRSWDFRTKLLHPVAERILHDPSAPSNRFILNNKRPPPSTLLMHTQYSPRQTATKNQQLHILSLGRSWSSLMRDLLVLILQRLPLPDYVRFGAVCRWWNTVLSSKPCPPAPHLPWIMRHPQPHPNLLLSFHCASDNRVYHLPKLTYEDENGNTKLMNLRYSFNRGWLTVSADNSSDCPCFLYNPISGTRIQLPPPPCALFCKLVVPPRLPLGDDNSPSCIAYFQLPHGEVGIWRPCNGLKQDWTPFLHEKFPDIRYGDIICYKCLLYALSNTGELRLIELNKNSNDDPPQAYTVISPLFSSPPRFEKNLAQFSLIECKGDLLMICHSFIDSMIQVFKANFSCGRWEEVESLGDQVLFLDFDLPICMSARDVPGYAENCVYFISRGRTFGRYHLEGKRLFENTDFLPDSSIDIWLLPDVSW